MKNAIAAILALLVSVSAFADISVAYKAAAKLKSNDTRTIVKEVENTDGNPCMPEGKSFEVDLQVKQASYDRLNQKVVYTWITAKTIGVDKDGHVFEVCAE